MAAEYSIDPEACVRIVNDSVGEAETYREVAQIIRREFRELSVVEGLGPRTAGILDEAEREVIGKLYGLRQAIAYNGQSVLNAVHHVQVADEKMRDDARGSMDVMLTSVPTAPAAAGSATGGGTDAGV